MTSMWNNQVKTNLLNMTYRLVLTCAVALLSAFINMELTLGGGSEDNCFFDAFEEPSWIDCISPILFEVQGEFNITAICLSGEDVAIKCLVSRLDECYEVLGEVLSFLGLTPEQAAAINMDSLWDAKLVEFTCELYGGDHGQCGGLSDCQAAPASIFEASAPLVEALQAVVRLCGPKCFHDNTDICPTLVNFFNEISYRNFTVDFDSERTQWTRMFVDGHCWKAADFQADCVVERLKSSKMKPCYDRVLNDSATALNSSDLHYDVCQMYRSMKICIDTIVKPECGPVSSDLLLEGILLTLSEKPSHSCLHSNNAYLKASASFLPLSVMILMLT